MRRETGEQVRHRHRLDVERELSGVGARECHEVAHQTEQALGLCAHAREHVTALMRLVEQYVRIADDDVQGRAQLVRDVGEELLLQPDQLVPFVEPLLEGGPRMLQLDAHALEGARERAELVLRRCELDGVRKVTARHDMCVTGEPLDASREAANQPRPHGDRERQPAGAEHEQDALQLTRSGERGRARLTGDDPPGRVRQRFGRKERRVERNRRPLGWHVGGNAERQGWHGGARTRACEYVTVGVGHPNEVPVGRRHRAQHLGELGRGEVDDPGKHAHDGTRRFANGARDHHVRPIEERARAVGHPRSRPRRPDTTR